MAYVDNEENKDQQASTLNTLGGQDPMLQQQQQQENAQLAPQTTSGQSATIGSGSGQQGSQAQSQASQGASQAPQQRGSGMKFSNIRKYIDANKPATQRMAGAATQTVQNQASNIGQQVQQQQQQTQQQIAQAQQQRGQAQDFAQGKIQEALQLEAGQEFGNPEDLGRFQALTSGQEQFANNLQYDDAAQIERAQQLGQLADSQRSAAGRGELLRQTFGTMGQQYGRGMRDLDNRLLGGTRPALKSLVEGTGEAATGIQDNIAQTREQMLANITGEQTADEALRTSLQDQLTGGQSGIMSDVQARADQVNSARKLIQDSMQGKITDPKQLEQAREIMRRELSQEKGFDDYLSERQAAAERIQGLDVARTIGQGGWLTDQINQARNWDSTAATKEAISKDPELAQMGAQVDSTRQRIQQLEKELQTRSWNQQARVEKTNLETQLKNLNSGIAQRRQAVEKSVANPFVRSEQAGQIYNELGRLTSQISNRDLAMLGMTREDLQQAMFKDLGMTDTGMGPGTQVNYANLYNTLGGLTDVNMNRDQLLNQFVDQAVSGKLKGANLDFLQTGQQATAAQVADANERARLAALSQLSGNEAWQLTGDQRFTTDNVGGFQNLVNAFATGAQGRDISTQAGKAGRADRWSRLRDL